eukprot:14022225-Alexandrium_andersonii.AAC.1
MDEAAVPAGLSGRNVIVQDLELGVGGKRGPLQLQLSAPGAPPEARRPRRAAPKPQGFRVPVFRRFQALCKDVSPCGACWDRSLIHMERKPLLNFSQLDMYLL